MSTGKTKLMDEQNRQEQRQEQQEETAINCKDAGRFIDSDGAGWLINGEKYYFHHIAYARGYMSRKATEHYLTPYSGKYGVGYVSHGATWTSTRYHDIYYYIRKEKNI